MARFIVPFALCLAAPLLTGCDGRAGTGYHGESLLSITGSVHIQNDDASGGLLPALAFRNSKASKVEIVDVDVKGDFPARFTLDVFTPPPESAMFEGKVPGEPEFALGYIAAVTPDHARSIAAPSSGSSTAGCGTVDPDGGREGCFQERAWCQGSNCYVERSNCDPDFASCTLATTTGDPELKKELWDTLAGFSLNYMVLYLSGRAEATTYVSQLFSGERALEAGYHLLRVAQRTPEEIAELKACRAAVDQETLDEYNAAHGTSDKTLDSIEDNGERDAARKKAAVRAGERGCKSGGLIMDATIGPTESMPIAIEIGTDLVPVFQF